MPIFMDRHDLSDAVTAEEIARLHQEDLKIQKSFGCRGLTYWFDEIRKTAFCLIEAPDHTALQEMHRKAHGDVPHQIIEVDPGIVESFLGRIGDPVRAKSSGLNIINDPAFRTILVISVSMKKPGDATSSAQDSSIKKFHEQIGKRIAAYEGTPVQQLIHNYLVSFKSVTQAIRCAHQIQLDTRKFNQENKQHKLLLKIGVSAGVPVTEKKLIFEDTIKLAERICHVVTGEMIVSAEVKELYQRENAGEFIKDKNIQALNESDEKFITLLMDFLEQHWTNSNLQVDHFTRAMGFSKSQLYRKIVALTGKSPNELIREYRLQEALKKLQRKNSNISEIAFETGFSSPSYFTKCFKKHFGVLPAIYLHRS